MKTFRLLVLLAALIFAGVALPSRARAQDDAVSFDFFYDSLAPYGEWIEVGDYGLCWRPTRVDPDWSPYTDGYWAYTDAGWTWVGYEEFGGIVYHYGRWLHLDDDSWCWTPGYEWAPAWVSWRSNDDYVGWAPLPPEARWAQDTGISVWVDSVCDIGPGYYNFCHVRDFGAPVLRGVLCRRSDSIVIFRSTVNVTNISYNTAYYGGPVIFNGGPSFDVISRVSERPIPALKLVQNTRFDAAHWRDHRGPAGRVGFNEQTVGNQLIVAAPRVLRPTDPAEFRSKAKRMLAGDSVTKGWDMVKDPEVRRQLHAEIGRQAKGLSPQTAPARRVTAADLKVVPPQADPNAVSPTAERHEKFGKGQRPEGFVGQPGNPPAARSAEIAPGTPSSSPNRSETPFRDHSHMQNVPPATTAPGANGLLKPFNPNAETQTRPVPQNVPGAPNPSTPIGRERSNEALQQQRAEQERAAQQRRAEMPNQRPQEEAPKNQAEQQRQQQLRQEQRELPPPPQRGQQQQIQQQQQQQREQQLREQQQQQAQRQQQLLQQREQQQQQPRQQQPQQQPPQPMERNNDARRAQEAERERDRQRQQFESQRNAQPEQRQAPPQGNPPQQGSQHPGGGHSSKDGKDKDKDKDKN
jgi:hypothetical protein